MPRSTPLTETDGEVRELKAADLKRFQGASALPESLQRKLGVRGPQKARRRSASRSVCRGTWSSGFA